MITRVEIDGFKSFHDFALDLEPLTIIAGPNAAGKSNLFDALHLLSKLAEPGLPDAFAGGRGRFRDNFACTRGDPGRGSGIAVELLLPRISNAHPPLAQTRFRYELTIERREESLAKESLVLVDERLSSIRPADDE